MQAWLGVLCVLASALVCAGCNDATQPTPPQNCQYSVSPSALAPCMRAAQFTATVTTTAGCSWNATASVPWMTITAGTSGSGSGAVVFSVTDNWDAPRSGVLTVRPPSSATGQDVRVSQAGCYYSVTVSAFAFSAAGGSDSFTVMQMSDPNTCGGPQQDACVWTAQSDSTWVTVAGTMPQSGDQLVRFTVAPNPTGTARQATITVRNKTVRITQAG